jgi:hypothetical protein
MLFTLTVALIMIVPLAWLALGTINLIFEHDRPKVCWTVFYIMAFVGVILGWQVGLFEYQVADNLRIAGCPLPGIIFHLEDGRWVDYVTPAYPLNFILNLVIITLATLAPLRLMFRKKS